MSLSWAWCEHDGGYWAGWVPTSDITPGAQFFPAYQGAVIEGVEWRGNAAHSHCLACGSTPLYPQGVTLSPQQGGESSFQAYFEQIYAKCYLYGSDHQANSPTLANICKWHLYQPRGMSHRVEVPIPGCPHHEMPRLGTTVGLALRTTSCGDVGSALNTFLWNGRYHHVNITDCAQSGGRCSSVLGIIGAGIWAYPYPASGGREGAPLPLRRCTCRGCR